MQGVTVSLGATRIAGSAEVQTCVRTCVAAAVCGCALCVCVVQVSRLMGMGPEENVADQIAGKLEDMLAVVRKVCA